MEKLYEIGFFFSAILLIIAAFIDKNSTDMIIGLCCSVSMIISGVMTRKWRLEAEAE